jgi:predicted  nucleic acid-binding Zn-ribbon protein
MSFLNSILGGLQSVKVSDFQSASNTPEPLEEEAVVVPTESDAKELEALKDAFSAQSQTIATQQQRLNELLKENATLKAEKKALQEKLAVSQQNYNFVVYGKKK